MPTPLQSKQARGNRLHDKARRRCRRILSSKFALQCPPQGRLHSGRTVLAGIGLTSDPHGPSSIESGFSQLVYPKDEGQDLGSLVVALQNGGKSAKFVAEILPPCTAGKP